MIKAVLAFFTMLTLWVTSSWAAEIDAELYQGSREPRWPS